MTQAQVDTAEKDLLFDAFFEQNEDTSDTQQVVKVKQNKKRPSQEVVAVKGRNGCGADRGKEGDEDDEERELDISRSPDFYKTDLGNVWRIGRNILLKLFYHPDKSNFFVFWRKTNKSNLLDIENTHMVVSCFEIEHLWKIVQEVCDEIETTPWNLLPQSHQCAVRDITDKDSEEYWSEHEGIAKWLPSKAIAVRSYKDQSGVYFIRILMKRQYPSLRFQNWIGRTMSLRLPEAKTFVQALKKCQQMISDADIIRIKIAKDQQQDRENINATQCVEITPPDSPD